MKTAWSMLAVLALVFSFTLAQAEGKKEDKKDDEKVVTLKGTVTCAKCDLDVEKKCTTVIKVKEKDKDVIYYLDDASGKKIHGKICKTPTKGTVKGTVKKEKDKLIITATEVKLDE